VAEPRTLVIACGALTRELRAVLGQIPGAAERCSVVYLPANLHNRPDAIPGAVEAAADAAGAGFDRVFVAYADCGTGGLLDPVVARLGATRLPGAHCYEVFAGAATFAALADAEPGTFYLTDYLARHFDALVVSGLGLDTHLRALPPPRAAVAVRRSRGDDTRSAGRGHARTRVRVRPRRLRSVRRRGPCRSGVTWPP
jgi:hypothetical protein